MYTRIVRLGLAPRISSATWALAIFYIERIISLDIGVCPQLGAWNELGPQSKPLETRGKSLGANGHLLRYGFMALAHAA